MSADRKTPTGSEQRVARSQQDQAGPEPQHSAQTRLGSRRAEICTTEALDACTSHGKSSRPLRVHKEERFDLQGVWPQRPCPRLIPRLFCLASVAFAAACSGSFQNLPAQHLPRALDAQIYLETEQPLDKKSGAVQLHKLSGILIHIGSSQVPAYSHVMVVRTRDTKQHALYFKIPDNLVLPLEQGGRIELHYKARWDSKTRQARRSVVIRDGRNDIKVLFQEQHLLEDALLPDGLQITPGKRISYTESGRFTRFCTARVEHRAIRLTHGDASQTLLPGERTIFRVGTQKYVVVAVDNSATVQSDCPDFSINRYSWFAIKSRLPGRRSWPYHEVLKGP